MKHVSIRAVFILIGMVTLCVAGAMAAIGIANVIRLGDRLVELNVSAEAVRFHLEADMMHDALRGDVLAAMVLPEGAGEAERAEVRDAVAEHSGRFREVSAALEALGLPDDVHEHLMAMAAPLDTYAKAAAAQVELSFSDRRAAIANQPNFDAAFRVLEVAMEQVSEEVQALNDARTEEGLATADAAKTNLILAAVAGVVLALAGIWMGMGLIVRPIIDLTAAVGAVAAGDTARSVPRTDWRNEVGSLAKAIESFKRGVEDNNRLRAQQEQQASEATAERRKLMLDLAARLETGVGAVVQNVTAAASRLQQFAKGMASVSERATGQAIAVESSSQQATENVQVVAARTEELTASVNEIGQQVGHSSAIIGDAVVQATQGSTQMQRLAEAAQRIGDVSTMINAIAGQTNLLALNATIEAARAGEAGKGFAVVASEVKALANQTSKATEDIRIQIAAIQEATKAATTSIEVIAATIGRVNETATAISAAVQQQSAATVEIARNAQRAADGNRDVSTTIQSVTEASRETGTAANDVLGAAETLDRDGAKLRLEVDEFLRQVRAA
jgi:methyl-accepting chemotaxis protein